MVILLALGSAALYGVVDVAGGLLSRRASFIGVAFIGQATSLVAMLIVAPLVPARGVVPEDLAWGALSGVGTGIGMLFLYRGLSRGPMSVVVPVSAVTGVALAVLVGVVFVGERPSITSWEGILLAGPALWLVSRERQSVGILQSRATVDGLIASVGIALQYVALAQAGGDSGAWPVTAGRLSAALALLPFALWLGRTASAPPFRSRCPQRLSVP